MQKRSTASMLRFFIPLFWILFCFFPSVFWAEVSIVSQTPASNSWNNPINTSIRFQFSASMDTSNTWIDLYDQYDNQIDLKKSWSTTVHTNDTVTLTPINALPPAMGIEIEGWAQSVTEGSIRFKEASALMIISSPNHPRPMQPHQRSSQSIRTMG
jgi:methionine-rich copper-binding protein CopC